MKLSYPALEYDSQKNCAALIDAPETMELSRKIKVQEIESYRSSGAKR